MGIAHKVLADFLYSPLAAVSLPMVILSFLGVMQNARKQAEPLIRLQVMSLQRKGVNLSL